MSIESRPGDHLNQFEAPDPIAEFGVLLTFDGYKWVAQFNPEGDAADLGLTTAEGATVPIALINLSQSLQAFISRTRFDCLNTEELALMLGITQQEAIAIVTHFQPPSHDQPPE